VDDHRIVRQGVRLLLEQAGGLEVVGDAADCVEALAKAGELRPDVVVLDIHMPLVDGFETCRRLTDQNSPPKVVVLSSDFETESAQRALRSGASGYVLKEAAGEELVQAIRIVMAGRLYLCPEITTKLIRAGGFQDNLGDVPKLSARESELLRLIAAGLRNKEIAAKLELSIKAVEANRSRLMAKLGCKSLAELVRFAVREGIAPV